MSAKVIALPVADDRQLLELHVGDEVRLTGILYTARDAAHKYLAAEGSADALPPGLELSGTALYHCGPVMVPAEEGGWRVTAAGPTTSAREEEYEGTVLKKYGVKIIIGKGGMGAKTKAALQEYGAVYLSSVGGAAQVLAAAVKRVDEVFFLDKFGSPEAMWKLEVEDFPAIVTMDAHGGDIHEDVRKCSQAAVAAASARL